MSNEPQIPARHSASAVDLSALVQRGGSGRAAGAPGADGPGMGASGAGMAGLSAPGAGASGAGVSGVTGSDAGAQAPSGRHSAASAGSPAPTGRPGAPAAEPSDAPVATLPDVVIDGDDSHLEQLAQLSQFVPVLVEMHAAWSSEAQALSPKLARAVRALRGRAVLLRIDLDAHPHVGRQPQVLAILGGRPVQLFAGDVPEAELAQVLGELVEISAAQGMGGRVASEAGFEGEGAGEGDEPREPAVPEHLKAARDAVNARDWAAAIAEYERLRAERPADDQVTTELARTRLLQRLDGHTAAEIRSAAAEHPTDADAQLLVADLDLQGGHVEDAFARILDLFAASAPDARTPIRERLLELFLVVGTDDPRVARARARLSSLLF